jgi:predicted N-acetyltransferase YhbS
VEGGHIAFSPVTISENHPDVVLDGVPQEYFLALPFVKEEIHGVVMFHQGFTANG